MVRHTYKRQTKGRRRRTRRNRRRRTQRGGYNLLGLGHVPFTDYTREELDNEKDPEKKQKIMEKIRIQDEKKAQKEQNDQSEQNEKQNTDESSSESTNGPLTSSAGTAAGAGFIGSSSNPTETGMFGSQEQANSMSSYPPSETPPLTPSPPETGMFGGRSYRRRRSYKRSYRRK